MLTKQDAINLAQKIMASGEFPADLRDKYPIPVISRVLNGIFELICKKSPIAKAETAIEYPCEVIEGNCEWYIELPARPISGLSSFMYVRDGSVRLSMREKAMQDSLEVLRGGVEDDLAILKTQRRIYLTSKPRTSTLQACYVPNIYDMEMTDVIVADGFETYLMQGCIEFMRQGDMKPQDRFNDGRVDLDLPPKE